jgi:hypothetical protein
MSGLHWRGRINESHPVKTTLPIAFTAAYNVIHLAFAISRCFMDTVPFSIGPTGGGVGV